MTDGATLRTPALMAAFSTAMSARAGQVTPHQVDEMRIKAEELLDRDDPVRSAIITFATKYEELRRDLYALRILGENLEAEVGQALNPDHVARRHRADLDD